MSEYGSGLGAGDWEKLQREERGEQPNTRKIEFEIPDDAFKPGDRVISLYHMPGEWEGTVTGYWFLPKGYYPNNEGGDGPAWGIVAYRQGDDDPLLFSPLHLKRSE